MRGLPLATLLLCAPAAAGAQSGACPAPIAGSVHVAGEVPSPTTFDMTALRGMPQTTVESAIHGGEAMRWTGVPVRALLDAAGVPSGGDIRGPHMRTVVIVEASDGYSALFALPELDDAFTDRVTLLAHTSGGEPLPAEEGPLRIIAPDEKRGARQVRQVTCLRVVNVG